MAEGKYLRPAQIKSVKADDKYIGTKTPTKYNLKDHLYLYVYWAINSSSGMNKIFKFRMLHNGKLYEKTIGKYPIVEYLEAKNTALEYEKKVLSGQSLKEPNNGYTFESFCLKWFEDKKQRVTEHTKYTIRHRVGYFIPSLGKMKLRDIKQSDIMEVAQKIIKRGHTDTANRATAILSEIFRYAIDLELAEKDPAAVVLRNLPKTKKKHYAAETAPAKVADILRRIWGYKSENICVSVLIKLAPYIFQRPGEIRGMLWKDIDLVNGEWTHTVTKTNTIHTIPLSKQVVKLLKSLYPVTGCGKYVFISERDFNRQISNNTIRSAYITIGFKDEQTEHGWRATALTMLAEQLDYSTELIHEQLAHTKSGPQGTAYDRTKYIEARRRMLQVWADYIDELREGKSTPAELSAKYRKIKNEY